MQEVLQNISAGANANREVSLAILRAFTKFTYTMHEAGVLHHDHNASNTLVNKASSNYQFAIIDINRMQFKSLRRQERLQNFVRLSDDLCVMKTIASVYAECINISPARCYDEIMTLKRRHWRRIAAKRKFKKLIGRS